MTDYYAALGLTPDAKPDEIKHAYRLRAKAVHPDAGGSPEAMERVNEAYRMLSDPPSRKDYDALRTRPARPDGPDADPASYIAETDHLKAVLHHRMRQAQARRAAWDLIKPSAGLSVLLGIIVYFFSPQATTLSQRVILALIAFVPVYIFLVGVVFLINPELRLHIHDLITNRRARLTRHETAGIAALVVAFFPLAALWALLYVKFRSLL